MFLSYNEWTKQIQLVLCILHRT